MSSFTLIEHTIKKLSASNLCLLELYNVLI